jgi:glycosyltransferase involved in cell wall biosynthesis
MRIIVDAREYDALRPAAPHVYGASEPLVVRIVNTLARAGHIVDAVWKGQEELIVDGVRWWPWDNHPRKCDVLVSCEWLIHANEFEYDRLIVPLNKINPILAGLENHVEAYVAFSEEHRRELVFYTPTIRPNQVVIIPPGVDMPDQSIERIPHRVVWTNAIERGLIHLARQWPDIRKKVPDATLAITYGLERSWENNKWQQDNIAQELAECRRWVKANSDSVFDLGVVQPHAKALEEFGKAELYSYPADAPLPGIVTSFAAMEAASAGCMLLLSTLEGLPEVFEHTAEFLSIPVNEQEWVDKTCQLLTMSASKKRKLQKRSIEWAKARPWRIHEEGWLQLVEGGNANYKRETEAVGAEASVA